MEGGTSENAEFGLTQYDLDVMGCHSMGPENLAGFVPPR